MYPNDNPYPGGVNNMGGISATPSAPPKRNLKKIMIIGIVVFLALTGILVAWFLLTTPKEETIELTQHASNEYHDILEMYNGMVGFEPFFYDDGRIGAMQSPDELDELAEKIEQYREQVDKLSGIAGVGSIGDARNKTNAVIDDISSNIGTIKLFEEAFIQNSAPLSYVNGKATVEDTPRGEAKNNNSTSTNYPTKYEKSARIEALLSSNNGKISGAAKLFDEASSAAISYYQVFITTDQEYSAKQCYDIDFASDARCIQIEDERKSAEDSLIKKIISAEKALGEALTVINDTENHWERVMATLR